MTNFEGQAINNNEELPITSTHNLDPESNNMGQSQDPRETVETLVNLGDKFAVNFDSFKDMSPKERSAAMYNIAENMSNQLSLEKSSEKNTKLQEEIASNLNENFGYLKEIEVDIANEKIALNEKYGPDESLWPKNVMQANNSHKLGWGFMGLTAGVSVLGGVMPSDAYAESNRDSATEIRGGVEVRVGEAREDAGGVVSGAVRIIIERKVNDVLGRILSPREKQRRYEDRARDKQRENEDYARDKQRDHEDDATDQQRENEDYGKYQQRIYEMRAKQKQRDYEDGRRR